MFFPRVWLVRNKTNPQNKYGCFRVCPVLQERKKIDKKLFVEWLTQGHSNIKIDFHLSVFLLSLLPLSLEDLSIMSIKMVRLLCYYNRNFWRKCVSYKVSTTSSYSHQISNKINFFKYLVMKNCIHV